MIEDIRVNLSVCGRMEGINETMVTYQVVKNNWMYAQACLVVAFVFNLLVLFTLLKFARTKRLFQRKKKTRNLIFLAISYPVVACVKISANQLFLLVGKFAPENEFGCKACYAANVCQNLMSLLCAFNIFMFLWYRLQLLYSEPSMKKFRTPLYKTVNFLSLGFYAMMISVVVGVAFTGYFPNFVITSQGCLLVNKKVSVYKYLITSSLAAKLMMLAIFVYPLCYKKMQLYREKKGSATPTVQNNLLERRLYGAIKRTAMSALIFPLFNMLVYGLKYTYGDVRTSSLRYGFYACCYMMTGVCIVLCFEKPWKTMTILFRKTGGTRASLKRQAAKTKTTPTNTNSQVTPGK